MPEKLIIGFDFSINKPAATFFYKNHISIKIWPIELTKLENETYAEMSKEIDFKCINRDLDSISKNSKMSTSQMTLISPLKKPSEGTNLNSPMQRYSEVRETTRILKIMLLSALQSLDDMRRRI